MVPDFLPTTRARLAATVLVAGIVAACAGGAAGTSTPAGTVAPPSASPATVAPSIDATGSPASSPAVDPTGPATGTIKVEKGGWWGSNPFVARSAYRHYEDPPDYLDKHIGFRIASQ